MITTDFLSDLNRFRLIVRKKVTSSYAGGRTSTFLGKGSTIKDYRAYVNGDDIRLIDWKIYARTDDLYVKRFEEEKNLTIHILLDHSASMDFGIGTTKFDFASMLSVGFAYLALRDNDRFQFSLFAEGIEISRPYRGMQHLASMVDQLNHQKLRGQSRFSECIRQYKKHLTTRALVIVVSDFLYDLEDIKLGLYMLGNNDIKLIQVLDKDEVKLKLEGDVRLHDSEDKTALRTYLSPRLKQTYQARLQAHIQGIEKICDQLNVGFFPVSTAVPVFDVFYEVLNRQT